MSPLTIDNRNVPELVDYLEARIEALVRRVHELEYELEVQRDNWRALKADELEKLR